MIKLLIVEDYFMIYKYHLAQSDGQFFVDNNAARDIAISGAARSPTANKLLDMLLLDEYSAEILAWFQREPSPSNPADAFSRSLLKSVDLHGVEVPCEDISDMLKELESSLRGPSG